MVVGVALAILDQCQHPHPVKIVAGDGIAGIGLRQQVTGSIVDVPGGDTVPDRLEPVPYTIIVKLTGGADFREPMGAVKPVVLTTFVL